MLPPVLDTGTVSSLAPLLGRLFSSRSTWLQWHPETPSPRYCGKCEIEQGAAASKENLGT